MIKGQHKPRDHRAGVVRWRAVPLGTMIEDRTRRLLDVRLARDQAGQRLPSVTACVARDGEVVWTGGRSPPAGPGNHCHTPKPARAVTTNFRSPNLAHVRHAAP